MPVHLSERLAPVVSGKPLTAALYPNAEERVLVLASLDLIKDPAQFSTVYMARANDGSYRAPASDDASSWCAVGSFERYPSCFTVEARNNVRMKMHAFVRTMNITEGVNYNYHRIVPDRIAFLQYLNDGIIAIVLDDGRTITEHEGVIYLFQKYLELPVIE